MQVSVSSSIVLGSSAHREIQLVQNSACIAAYKILTGCDSEGQAVFFYFGVNRQITCHVALALRNSFEASL